jgi:hypothetical protein
VVKVGSFSSALLSHAPPLRCPSDCPTPDSRLPTATLLETTLIARLQVLIILNSLNFFRMNTFSGILRFAQFWCNLNPFRMNTSKSVSKQRALTTFRMNTYEKQGGGAPQKVNNLFRYPLFLKSFSCNTYAAPRKCCKQKTYGSAKSQLSPVDATLTKNRGCLIQAKCPSLSSPWRTFSSTGAAMIARTRSRNAGTSSLASPLVSMVSCR